MSTKKFSELPELTALATGNDAGNEFFALTDNTDTRSKYITSANLVDSILSADNIGSKAGTIITKLNAHNTGANGLNATNLFYNGTYQPAAYFLQWGNIQSKPSIPTNIKELTNEGNFIHWDNSLPEPKMKVADFSTGQTSQTMNSDYLNEGTENLFYTDQRVDDRQTLGFGALFNAYSSTFDSGRVFDSLSNVSGEFPLVSITNNQSSVIRVADSNNAMFDSFTAGQTIRLYGASLGNSPITTSPTLGAIDITGTAFGQGSVSQSPVKFSYKASLFDLDTGEVGPMSSNVDINLDLDTSVHGPQILSAFNEDIFTKVPITGVDVATQGVLLYRQVGNAGDYKLIAVLGPKDLLASNMPYKDYYTFDYTSWSGKNPLDNTFDSIYPISHFPVVASSTQFRGWCDVTIKSVTNTVAGFDINLGTSSTDQLVYVDADRQVSIYHNDTTLINNAITQKAALGRKDIVLNAKDYNASHISVPDNFGIIGTTNITKITKLPWTSFKGTTPDNSLIKSTNASNATSISIIGIDLDGEIKNQYLLNDSASDSLNYLVDLGQNPSSILIDRSRFKNMIGGGIYASSPVEFKLTTTEVINSGLSDRHTFSPAVLDSGTNTMINNSVFRNFTDSIDVSVTDQGSVTNNIIKNCGSGLFVYGSTFFLSSPNVLIGPANEFLQSPDVLNSEFDSININRSSFTTPPFTMDPLNYQENGASFDLTQDANTGGAGQVSYRLNFVRQLSDGSSEVYGAEVGPGARGIDNGELSSSASPYGLITGKRYTITRPGDVNWVALGARNNDAGTSFIMEAATVATSANATPNETTTAGGLATNYSMAGYGSNAPITLTPISSNLAGGEFKFQVADPSFTALTQGAYRESTLQTLYTTGLGTSFHPAGSKHLGIAWSANFRNHVSAGTLFNAGVWDNGSGTGPNGSELAGIPGGVRGTSTQPYFMTEYTFNTVALRQKQGETKGSTVRINESTFSAGGAEIYGEVEFLTAGSTPATKRAFIKFFVRDGNTLGAVNTGVGDGTINIVDNFVLAQGLIK